MEQLSVQKRIFIAVLLTFAFFIAYDYFYLSKFQVPENNATGALIDKQSQNTEALVNEAPNAKNDKVAPAKAVNKRNVITQIKGKIANFSIDDLGRINSYVLNESKYKNDDKMQIDLVDLSKSPLPLEMRFSDPDLNELAFKTPYVASASNLDITKNEQNLVLTQNLGDVLVTKNITFYPNGSYKISVQLNKNAEFFIAPGSRPNIVVDGYTVHGVLIRKDDESLKMFEDGDVDSNENIQNANIAAASDRYYTTFFYDFTNKLNLVISSDSDKVSQIFAKADKTFEAGGFIGPKHYDLLTGIDKRLSDVIEYGWFTFISKPMFGFLKWLHNYTGNWGWAIVIMTLIVRAILYPLSYKGMLSMNKMKDLAPKMKELQARYKGDPKKLQTSMMELYKKNNVNPMGGCLPILLQVPIFFAIYRVLLNAIELKGAEWAFWIHDLSVKDPYFILPITMGILMFLQQKITPTNFTDPMQEKIMKFLPLIFTFFFMAFPAGLTLYWTVNNLASIIQQYTINKMFAKHKAAIKEEKNESRS